MEATLYSGSKQTQMKSIIYLPSISNNTIEDTANAYARRYMQSLDKMNPDKTKKYYLEEELRFELDEKLSTPVTSIFEYSSNRDDGKEVCRIYECSYESNLTERFKKTNVLAKMGLILLILISKTGVLLKTLFKRNSLSGKKRLEVFYFFTFLCFVAVSAVLLFPAILTSLTGILSSLVDDKSILSSGFLDNMSPWMTLSYWITTMTALITSVFPKFGSFVSDKATDSLCIDAYLTMGNNKLEITGKLESLIEKVTEEEDYQSLELHGYGFGGIVIIDAFFPYGNSPNFRLGNEVRKIVTIRCPHDFIATYYPDYFKKRGAAKNMVLERWTNIYSEADVLSSDFEFGLNSETEGLVLEEKGIKIDNHTYHVTSVEKLGFWKYLGLFTLKTHQKYWGEGTAANCIYLTMESQFEQSHPILK